MGTYRYELAEAFYDISKCLEVRRQVFVEGQGIAQDQELDGLDHCCIHFICRHTQVNFGGGLTTIAPVATGRILPCGDTAKIQRVAVVETHQKKGVGAGIMKAMIDYARSKNFAQVLLGSQVDAVGFYKKLGFDAFGEQYKEVGILHQNMRLILQT